MRVAAGGRLPASPSRAFEALAAWEAQARWMSDAAAVRVLGPRREGVGTRVAVRTRVLGIPLFTDVLEVTRWTSVVGLEVSHNGPARGRGRWRLRPVPEGSEFLWDEDVRLPVPFLGELALLVYRPLLRHTMRRSIEHLAALLREAQRGRGPFADRVAVP